MNELEEKLQQLQQGDVPQPLAHDTGHPIGPVEFTVADFMLHKKRDEVCYSLPFHTRPCGYKLCLGIWANGFGDGKGTHLGLTIHVMRGEFDDLLKWPFRGKITIDLVNQEDVEHHNIATVISFGDHTPDRMANRVTEGERNIRGWGNCRVLPLTNLLPVYLKNDSVKLYVKNVQI